MIYTFYLKIALFIILYVLSLSCSFKSERNAVNLDVSAMMAYVSSSTNGGCYAVLDSPILADQAKREKTHPVKQMLDKIFEGK